MNEVVTSSSAYMKLGRVKEHLTEQTVRRIWDQFIEARPVILTTGRPDDLQIHDKKIVLNAMDMKPVTMLLHEIAHVVEVPDERLGLLNFGMIPGAGLSGPAEQWEWDAEERVLAIHINLMTEFMGAPSAERFGPRAAQVFGAISGRHKAFSDRVQENVQASANQVGPVLVEYERKLGLVSALPNSTTRRKAA